MIEAKAEKLVAAGINLIPTDAFPKHFVFERGGFVALVERTADGFGNMGSAGLLTEQGLAVLLWEDGRAYFKSRGHRVDASEEQVAGLRAFSADLQSILGGS